MMNKFKIVIKDNFFLSENDTNIFTGIYIDSMGVCFPDGQWTDFVEFILGTWLHNLLKEKNSINTKFSLYFMDGPYRLDVYKNSNMQLDINCISARDVDKIEHKFSCTYSVFLQELYSAIETFNQILYNKNMYKGEYENAYKQTIIFMEKIKEEREKMT